MGVKVTKIPDAKILYFIALLIGCAVLISVKNYNSLYSGVIVKGQMPITALIFCIIILYTIIEGKIAVLNPLFFLTCFYAILILPSVDITGLSINDIVKNIIVWFQWIFYLFFGFIIGYKMKSEEQISKLSAVLVIIILPFPLVDLATKYFSIDFISTEQNRDALFPIFVFFPFVLLLKNEKLKILLIFIFAVLGFLSMKLSIIIALIVSTLFYIFLTNKRSKGNILNERKKRSKLSRFALITILVIIAISIFQFTNNNLNITAVQRFQDIQESGGTGRVKIYSNIWNHIQQSNTLDLLLGHGYLAVLNINNNVKAHNDLLEILYDFGLITLIAFLTIAIKILSYGFKMLKHPDGIFDKLIPTFFSAYILWIILGSFNCMIFNSMYYSILMLFFGISIGFYHNYLHEDLRY